MQAAADVTPPTLNYTGANPITVERGYTYTPPTVTATDNIDGNITGSIVQTGDTVDVNTPGSYTLNYNVADAAGNNATQLNITVNVTPDATAPIITYGGPNPITLSQGDTYTPPTVTASDNIDGSLTGSIVQTGDTVDPNTAGTYQLHFDVTDSAGNNAIRRTITVQVTAAVDIDGIDNAIEDAGLNGGDGNGDGIKDSSQANVASMVNSVSGKYFTLETMDEGATTGAPSRCTSISSLSVINENERGKDKNFDYPIGMIDFELACSSAGDKAVVTIYLDSVYDTSRWQLRKNNKGYSRIDSAVFGQATVGSLTVTTVTYTITDGGPLDEDGVANATIVDPVGPAVLANASTTTPENNGNNEQNQNSRSLQETGVKIAGFIAVGVLLTGLAAGSASVTRKNKYKL